METNRNAIKHSLRVASNALEGQMAADGLKIEVQEATREESGSPNIPALILSKIEASDIFVCDISTINTDAPANFRRMPNPNVTFELGYAAAHLGWDRVIMLFNTAFGNLSKDPPFDFDRQRISQFNIDLVSTKTKGFRTDLDKLLTRALELVIVNDPPRPAELKRFTPAQTKRKRDTDNLRWILATTYWPSVDDHLQSAPHTIHPCIFHFWEGFNGVLNSSLFHLYDTKALKEIRAVQRDWATTLSFGQHYRPDFTGHSVFSTPLDMPLSAGQQRDWKKIEVALQALASAKEVLLQDVRRRYLEFDVDALSEAARVKYVQTQKR